MSVRVLDVSGDRASDFIKDRLAEVPPLLGELFILEGVSTKSAGEYFALALFSPDDNVVRLARRSEARTKLTELARKLYGGNFKKYLTESIISKCEAAPEPGTLRVAYFHEGRNEGGCGSAVFMMDGGDVADMFDAQGPVIRKFNEGWADVVERVKKVVIPPSVTTANNVEATLMAAAYVFEEVTRSGGDEKTIAYLIGLHSRGNKTVRTLLDRMDESLRGQAYSGALQDFGISWLRSGFPKLEIGHKLAASLAMTDVPDDIEVLAPWEAWSLVIPPGLLPEESGKATFSRLLCVGTNIAFVITSAGSIIGPLSCKVEKWDDKEAEALDHTLNSLVKGACLALSNPDDYKRQSLKDKAASVKKPKREGDAPDFTVNRFMLSAPVQIDVRTHLLDYVRGTKATGGGAPKVQFFVRGHWRNQAHGPRMSLRKQMRIEGYWKGPEHGAIKLGNYKVKDE